MNITELNKELRVKSVHNDLVYQVGSAGNINSEIAIVAEYPGEAEVNQNRPLVGATGNELWNRLRKFNINYNDCYVTNVCKRRVVGFDSKTNTLKPPTRGEQTHWDVLLRWELSNLPNLKYILTLGNGALKALTGHNGITNWRGSVLPYKEAKLTYAQTPTVETPRDDITIVCTLNPAVLFREPKYAPMLSLDILKLDRVIKGYHSPTKFKCHINPTYREAIQWLNKLAMSKEPFGWDIETINNEIACHGFAISTEEGVCINLRDKTTSRYTLDEERMLTKRIQWLLAHNNARIVTQNGMFDATVSWFKNRIRPKPIWFDTMLAHHCLYPQLPHGLGFLTTQYTDNPYYKDEGKAWKEDGDLDSFWEYNIKDACNTLQCSNKMLEELKSQKLDNFFFSHVMRLQPELIRMTMAGVKCDISLRESVKAELTEDVNRIKQELIAQARLCTGDPEYKLNPNSTPNLKDLLFGRLQLSGRGLSIDYNNRQKMLEHPRTTEDQRKLLKLLNKYKKEHKFLSTYGDIPVDDDNRIRTFYKQTGVQKAPGRLSSSENAWHTGTNVQNQPARSYPLFIADDGYAFSYFDLSGAEARIVCYSAGIQKWVDDFNRKDAGESGFDPHRSTASQVFGIPYEDVPSFDRYEYGHNTEDKQLDGEPTLRYIGKRCLADSHLVLSRKGWIPIEYAYNTNCEIAIWGYNAVIRWETPSDWYKEYVYCGDLRYFEGESFSQMVTKDHRMLVYNNGKFSERTAEQLADKRYGSVPINGMLYNGVKEPLAALKAMAWADGHLEPNYPNSIMVGVSKPRKIERVRQLTSAANLKVTECITKQGMTVFRIYGIHFKSLDIEELLRWDHESRMTFLNELPKWDGCLKTGRVFNTDLEGMKAIQTVAHSCGFRSPIHKHGKPRPNEKQCYVLKLSNSTRAHYKSMQVYQILYTGFVYCPTVSTGAFLTKHNDKISVSLNCKHGLNYRMKAERLAETTGIDLRSAYKAYHGYHKAYPEIRQWWDRTIKEVTASRCLFNYLGRRLYIHGRLDSDEALESVVAFKPQSTIGDKVASVIYLCHSDPEWPKDALIVLNIHDALIALHKLEDGNLVRRIMKKHAETPIMIEGTPVIIPTEFKASVPDELGVHRWSTLKEVEVTL